MLDDHKTPFTIRCTYLGLVGPPHLVQQALPGVLIHQADLLDECRVLLDAAVQLLECLLTCSTDVTLNSQAYTVWVKKEC